MKMRAAAALLASVATGAPAQQAAPPTALFASDQPLRLTLRGPLGALSSDRSDNARPGTLTVAGAGDTLPVMLEARGITRRMNEICQFPPLRVDFSGAPPASSVFARQDRLKLVTHCKQTPSFQQKVLLEYAAYKIYNALSPLSFRVRLATIDYVDDRGKPPFTRVGFFIEDVDDLAARNGMVEAAAGYQVPRTRLEPGASARFAVFSYLIGNLDWSMRAGPVGDGCCHNSRLISASKDANATAIPVPYDFDFSGLVDAPYATPPEGFTIRSVRERMYRGYCGHLPQARAAAAEMVSRRAELLGLLATIPGLDERTRGGAAAYLDRGFRELASGKPFKDCVR